MKRLNRSLANLNLFKVSTAFAIPMWTSLAGSVLFAEGQVTAKQAGLAIGTALIQGLIGVRNLTSNPNKPEENK